MCQPLELRSVDVDRVDRTFRAADEHEALSARSPARSISGQYSRTKSPHSSACARDDEAGCQTVVA